MIDLAQVHSPEDIRKLSLDECEVLASQIRKTIIQTVAKNGGHLSSNLGAVELTLAIHRVFHCPQDKLIFDVGHQTYTHKLLTDRYKEFSSLRTYHGICGFPRKVESEYDVFETGHSSTAISAALGMARARDLKGGNNHVIAVVGDGALTGGMSYEALDDAGSRTTKLIVIVNDNEMSIAKNVGALSTHLSQLRASASWSRTKKKVRKGLQRIPLIGAPLYRMVHKIKSLLKRMLVSEGFFTSLGFHYLGPINGNDQAEMERILKKAKNYDEPVLIHCITKKGFGYKQAENEPEAFHGTAPFFVESGTISQSPFASNGQIANDTLISLAEKNPDICAITAAMPLGTSTYKFQKAYPERFYDVGIAEEHAVTLGAGMASQGVLPYIFVYSTFLQRGYDQVFQDVSMQNLHVVLMLDRAGIAADDGKTHHGLYDIAYLRHIPNMTILSPCCSEELKQMVVAAEKYDGPVAIRYPKAFRNNIKEFGALFSLGKWNILKQGRMVCVLAVGSMVEPAMKIADTFPDEVVRVINASTVKPLDGQCLINLAEQGIPVITLEEHSQAAGFGSSVLEFYANMGKTVQVIPLGIPEMYLEHGDRQNLLRDAGLANDQIREKIQKVLEKMNER